MDPMGSQKSAGTGEEGADGDGDGEMVPGNGGAHEGRDGGSREGRDDGPTTICWACNRPIDGASCYLWRGEPVHMDCAAEVQCGVRLKRPPAE